MTTTETQFTDTVMECARTFGWHRAHFRPARTQKGWVTPMQGEKGWPDLALARGGRIVFAELKRDDKGRASPEQQAWLAALAGDMMDPATLERIARPSWALLRRNLVVALWSPSAWDDIEAILR